MGDLSFYEKQHIQKLLQQEGSLKYIFDEFIRKAGMLLVGWENSENSNVWYRNSRIEKEIEKELELLHDKLSQNITNYSIDAWNRSNLKNDEMVSAYIEGMPISNIAKNGMFARNKEALTAFLNKKIDGETLSERVWNIAGSAKENIEHYLSTGISTGRPANLISQDIRQLLKEPDRRFRRIRNEEGKLVLSSPMKDYHPGQGVYRSSFMNAKRLVVSETNAAYRMADCTRWDQLDFVLGVDIKRSNSNKGPCSICDPLVGRYPKGYIFRGWHPFCICFATPVLMDEDAFIDSLVDETIKADYVMDIPESSRNYFETQIEKGTIKKDSFLFVQNSKFLT